MAGEKDACYHPGGTLDVKDVFSLASCHTEKTDGWVNKLINLWSTLDGWNMLKL